MKKSGGFTLIELMVVLAILGILLSFAYPSLTAYKRSSQETERSRSEEIVNKALRQYYAFEGSYPSVAGCDPSAPMTDAMLSAPDGKSGLLDQLRAVTGTLPIDVRTGRFDYKYDSGSGTFSITWR